MSARPVPLSLSQQGRVGMLRLHRPEKRNALTIGMLETWPTLLREAEQHSELRVLIVTGGSHLPFSAGADIDEFMALTRDSAARQRFCDAFAAAQTAMAEFPKPSIAMISGVCVGGGCGLALGCDLRLADSTASFGITPAKLGLDYGIADTKRLVDAVGAAHAAELLFSARLIGADQALAIGLISRIAEPSHLEADCLALAGTIAANAPSSLRAIKQHLQAIRAGQIADDEVSRREFFAAFDSPDFAEGLAAFSAKRPADFAS
jgi:enoyl-CoA hydratase/carnithine racemase